MGTKGAGGGNVGWGRWPEGLMLTQDPGALQEPMQPGKEKKKKMYPNARRK